MKTKKRVIALWALLIGFLLLIMLPTIFRTTMGATVILVVVVLGLVLFWWAERKANKEKGEK